MLRLLVASGVLSLSLMANVAEAQSPPLSHLNKIHLEIERGVRADECGITDTLIHQAFMHSLGAAKFSVVDDPNSATFRIKTSGYRTDNASLCISAISITVYLPQQVKLTYSNATVTVPILLWEKTGVFSSGRPQHPSQVKSQIEALTKSFIAEWDLSNK